MIDKKSIEEVRQRADIYKTVADSLGEDKLVRKGQAYWACCPFHGEKTASLEIRPSHGTYHCFGCGAHGDSLNWLMEYKGMGFVEAVRELADDCHVTLRETTSKNAEKAREEHELEESLRAVTEDAARYFVERIHADVPEAKRALAYANRRWKHEEVKPRDGEIRDFPNEWRIGYSPAVRNALIRHLQAKGWTTEIMERAGLIVKGDDGEYRDVFIGRLMIPIYDSYHRVIGFTARDMTDSPDAPKYKNTKDTDIYKKGNVIFGLNTARRTGASEQRFYLVEGAPDVLQLQSIGITNTIAALGTSWTDDQFGQLKKFNATLCFIPDQDEKKNKADRFAAGTKAVIRNGCKAIELGLKVTVKELPQGKDGRKEDPDSYVKTRKHLDDLDEEDFIVWYAEKMLATASGIATEAAEDIKHVCSTLLFMDDFQQEAIIERMGGKWKGKVFWRKALTEAKAERRRMIAQKAARQSNIDEHKYGFYVEGHCYFSASGGKQWANFEMKPLFHIPDNDDGKRIFEVTNEYGVKRIVELRSSETTTIAKFKQKMESMGNFLWMASQAELDNIKRYLYSVMETAEEITQMGWSKHGFWAWGNGIVKDGQFLPVDDYGIVRMERTDKDGHPQQENYYLPAMSKIFSEDSDLFAFEHRFSFKMAAKKTGIPDFCSQLCRVFGDNGKIGFIFTLATIFRDVIWQKTGNFPILNLFGPKGSGKSELAHTLMALFVKSDTGINIQNSTVAALNDAIAQCSDALVHVDEYKNSIDSLKVEFLKGLYDGTGRTRMDMDRGKKRVTTRVDSSVVLSGQEMPTVDIALLARTIHLSFPSAVHTDEQKIEFNKLSTIRHMGLTYMTNDILRQREKMMADFPQAYEQAVDDVNEHSQGKKIEDRVLRDWAMILATFRILRSPLQLPWDSDDLANLIYNMCVSQNDICTSSNEMSRFWVDFGTLIDQGRICAGCDFKVVTPKTMKTNKVDRSENKNATYLLVRLSNVLAQYSKMAREMGMRVMPPASIEYYLRNLPAYLGKKEGSERFKRIINGQPQMQEKRDADGKKHVVPVYFYDHPMVFDYKMLEEQFNLCLDGDKESAESEEEEKDDLPF